MLDLCVHSVNLPPPSNAHDYYGGIPRTSWTSTDSFLFPNTSMCPMISSYATWASSSDVATDTPSVPHDCERENERQGEVHISSVHI